MDQSLQSSNLNSTSNHQLIESYHRVYLLSCAHCACFVSDRGMKAVLLLRPSITLFSTDGMPFNCGPLYPDANDTTGDGEQVERTCDCLTQSIGCFGCGNTIGYHIISPCSRCVDSVSKHRRAANGHRWVFHYGEVTYQERRYVDNEPGVFNAQCLTTKPSLNLSTIIRSSNSLDSSSSSGSSSPAFRDGDFPKPENLADFEGLDLLHHCLYFDPNSISLPSHHSNLSSRNPRPNPTQKQFTLKQGDPVYWHHLISIGERPLPVFTPTPLPLSRPAR
ncbi:hypothetical protein O181_111525 [Austropuccinia psidii MF-1]|uniref:Protein FAM72A n=1 Tax=Austropuccinia psidii MF-1 TaxID=1389203 RepID=A0A9Q3K2K6_9BASI|nr:hypothetical protein [Austropuccinia psidii MF-1]